VTRAWAWLAAACLAAGAWAAGSSAIAAFSHARGDAMPKPWTLVPLRGAAAARVEITRDEGRPVARITAQAASALLVHPLDADPEAAPLLRWRWKVDRVVAGADLRRREGDDYAARVYVTFAIPDASLTLWELARLRLARLFYGDAVPAAAICYVWDNVNPPGTTAWNSHSGQVRMVVVESGAGGTGRWSEVARDIAADYRIAFGERYPGPVPRVSGVAVSADTDQTGERVTAWFGDLTLEGRR
jgi:hypothetical protein